MPLLLFFTHINIHIKIEKYMYKVLTNMRINAII